MFRLALRPTEGLIGSVIDLLGLNLAIPDHTTPCRCAATLEVPRRSRCGRTPWLPQECAASVTVVAVMVPMSTAVAMPAVVMVQTAVVVPWGGVVMVSATPIARSDRVRCWAIGLVSGRRPVVEGLGAGENCYQQSQGGDDVDLTHGVFSASARPQPLHLRFPWLRAAKKVQPIPSNPTETCVELPCFIPHLAASIDMNGCR